MDKTSAADLKSPAAAVSGRVVEAAPAATVAAAAADSKSKAPLPAAAATASGLVIEVVAGTGSYGAVDGPLRGCQFVGPLGLCRYGDSLIVTDYYSIREVDGVLGVANPLTNSDNGDRVIAEYEACAVPSMMTAITALPRELAQVMAQYARPLVGHTRTIAGVAGSYGVDGPAHDGSQILCSTMAVALDTSDPVAGPQLMYAEENRVRCLNLRTRMITTVAGKLNGDPAPDDGPALQARITPASLAVTPNGVLYVVESGHGSVRRISAASRWRPAERMRVVTTLIGAPKRGKKATARFARSAAPSFQHPLRGPWTLAYAPPSESASAAAAGADADLERDVGRLYVGCYDGVHAFHLTTGERRHLVMRADVRSLALTDDDRLLAGLQNGAVWLVDTLTGHTTVLVPARRDQYDTRTHTGPVTSDPETSAALPSVTSFVIDKATRSLVVCADKQLWRVRGVDV